MRWDPNQKTPGTFLFLLIGGWTHCFTILFSYWFSITTNTNPIVTNQKKRKCQTNPCFFYFILGSFSNRKKGLSTVYIYKSLYTQMLSQDIPVIRGYNQVINTYYPLCKFWQHPSAASASHGCAVEDCRSWSCSLWFWRRFRSGCGKGGERPQMSPWYLKLEVPDLAYKY